MAEPLLRHSGAVGDARSRLADHGSAAVGLAVATPDRFNAARIRSSGTFVGADGTKGTVNFEPETLI